MKDTLNFNELARDARRALDEERECLTEMARKVESYGQFLAANGIIEKECIYILHVVVLYDFCPQIYEKNI